MRVVYVVSVVTLAALVLWTSPAHANMGMPVIGAVAPVSWLLLPLIILVEAIVARFVLHGGFGSSLKIAAIANAVSTLFGIPITWFLLVLQQGFVGIGSTWGTDTTWQKIATVAVNSAWLLPLDSSTFWMLPTAAAVLCIPFFFMSVLCEYLIVRRLLGGKQSSPIKKWAWTANAATYGPIMAILVFLAIKEMR